MESLTRIPRTQFGSAQIHPVGEHRQGLRRQGDLQLSGLCGLWPGEAPVLKSFGADPEARSISEEDLEPVVSPIGEHKQSAVAWFLTQTLSDQGVESVEPFAHVAGGRSPGTLSAHC